MSTYPHPTNPVPRFWKKVDVRGDDDCWEWKASTRGHQYSVQGYGEFVVHDTYERGRLKMDAHRFVMLLVGRDPEGKLVHHVCENSLCVNPSHLMLVTPSEHAEHHHQLVWTKEVIIEAMQAFFAKYGVSPAALDWNPSDAFARGHHERVERWKQNSWPYSRVVLNRFGTWNAALEASGLPSYGMGRRPRGHEMKRDSVRPA